MKNIYLLLLCFSSVLHAQTDLYFLEEGPIDLQGDVEAWSFKSDSIKLVNSSASDIKVVWERTEVGFSEDWSSQICDIKTCWFPEVYTESFNLAAGDTAFMYVQFINNYTHGQAQIIIDIYAEGDRDNLNDQLIFNGNIDVTSVSGLSAEHIELKLSPNPSQNFLKIQFDDIKGATTVRLYSVLGNLIDAHPTENHEFIQLPIDHLKEGIYWLTLTDATGKILASERFTKVD